MLPRHFKECGKTPGLEDTRACIHTLPKSPGQAELDCLIMGEGACPSQGHQSSFRGPLQTHAQGQNQEARNWGLDFRQAQAHTTQAHTAAPQPLCRDGRVSGHLPLGLLHRSGRLLSPAQTGSGPCDRQVSRSGFQSFSWFSPRICPFSGL